MGAGEGRWEMGYQFHLYLYVFHTLLTQSQLDFSMSYLMSVKN